MEKITMPEAVNKVLLPVQEVLLKRVNDSEESIKSLEETNKILEEKVKNIEKEVKQRWFTFELLLFLNFCIIMCKEFIMPYFIPLFSQWLHQLV